jgi:hypothetical protein
MITRKMRQKYPKLYWQTCVAILTDIVGLPEDEAKKLVAGYKASNDGLEKRNNGCTFLSEKSPERLMAPQSYSSASEMDCYAYLIHKVWSEQDHENFKTVWFGKSNHEGWIEVKWIFRVKDELEKIEERIWGREKMAKRPERCWDAVRPDFLKRIAYWESKEDDKVIEDDEDE